LTSRVVRSLALLVLLMAASVPSTAATSSAAVQAAVQDAVQDAIQDAVPAPLPDVPPGCDGWTRNPIFRIGQDHVVRRGDAVREVHVVLGSVTVEGRVCGDLLVVLGNVQLGPEAAVEGQLSAVGGSVTVAPGAAVDGELLVIGGQLQAPSQFRSGHTQTVVSMPVVGDKVLGMVPWLSRGLLLGRLIVPDLPWVWAVRAVIVFVQLVLNLLFPHAVGTATQVIVDRPLSTFAAGLLVLILTGPLVTLLAVTVIGIAALPVLVCALVVAWVIGKIAVARWIGTRVVGQADPDSRAQSTRSLLIGVAIVTVAYAVPLLGVVVWALTGVLGLGAASLAFVKGFRRENPPPARVVPPPSAPPPSPPPVSVTSPFSAAPSSSAPPMAPPPLGPGVPAPADTPAATFAPGGADWPLHRSADAYATEQVGIAAALLAHPRAGFAERGAAFALDTLLVVLTVGMLDLDRHEGAVLVLLVAYHVAFWLWKATTLGGIICQLRVVRIDGQPLRFVDALVRGLTAIFSLAAFGLGALWILRDPDRQSWHDKVAGTFVVKVPRNYPLP